MKRVIFTQSLEVSVYVELIVPDDWNDVDIDSYAEEFPLEFTVNTPYGFDDDETSIVSLVLDNVYIYDSDVHTVEPIVKESDSVNKGVKYEL